MPRPPSNPAISRSRSGGDTHVGVTLPGDGAVQAVVVGSSAYALPVIDPDRYEDLGPIGRGATGEVHRVFDRQLGRTLAMKTVHAETMANPTALARFIAEAQATAQLQHPGIVPVHDIGVRDDGRLCFTMREVVGRTLLEVIHDLHAGTEGVWTFRRLIDAFHRVCEAVAYAHARGVVHRDLKPENVMVGERGEVLVLDWGLAKVRGGAALGGEGVVTDRSRGSLHVTQAGSVAGTPAYMPPEQAGGHSDEVDARADVYALGAILYECLTGRAPYAGNSAAEIVRAVLVGPPPRPDGAPSELEAACLAAMARVASKRFADATALAAAIAAWLDGSKRREVAWECVVRAEVLGAEAERLRGEAAEARAAAGREREIVPTWASEDAKAALWRWEDEAARLDAAAVNATLSARQSLDAALRTAPEMVEAQSALVESWRAEMADAEARRDRRGAEHAEANLRLHLQLLPETNPVQRRVTAWLAGIGTITLACDPVGSVALYRFAAVSRRLMATQAAELGVTPLVSVAVPMGSYVLRILSEGRPDVSIPVALGRRQAWTCARPGAVTPSVIRLPPALGASECYVPPGFFLAGGDEEATDPLPRGEIWCDGFIAERFPVTNAEYIRFLDDLVERGREADALAYVPRGIAPLYGRDADGRFVLLADDEGDIWRPDWPVIMVDWRSAGAYAAWRADRTGLPWRLPADVEWEKMARGVDGRLFPWGNAFDPSWCSMRESHATRPMPCSVTAFPTDESVYGVRGCAGNVREWCSDIFRREGVALDNRRVHRGGSWNGTARACHVAGRIGDPPTLRTAHLGFRVVRSWG